MPPDEEPEDELEPDDEPEEELEPDDEPEPDDDPEPEEDDDPDEDEAEPEDEPDDEADPEEDPVPEGPPLEELLQPAAAIPADEAPIPTTTRTWNSFFVGLKASPPNCSSLQQPHSAQLAHASCIEPDDEPDDDDAVPDDEPPDEEEELVGPELELLEQPAATKAAPAAEAPMPTTTMTWNSFFVGLTTSPRTKGYHPTSGGQRSVLATCLSGYAWR